MTLNTPGSQTPIEIQSGKDASYENFPVGSWLLPRPARKHVATFYRFARTIDDIADTPHLSPAEKLRYLEGYERAVLNNQDDDAVFHAAAEMRESLRATEISPRHCVDLIAAFKQDAVQQRYADWNSLVDYCLLSAAPVGRYLIDLMGGVDDDYTSSDALCIALQIINHLQDCGDDYRTLNRVYLPQEWLVEAAAEEGMLAHDTTSPELSTVIYRCIRGVEVLLNQAALLSTRVKSRRLAMEAAAIHEIALALVCALKAKDVLNKRVILSKPQYAVCIANGVIRSVLGKPGRESDTRR